MQLISLFLTIFFFLCYTVLILYYRKCWQEIPDYKIPSQIHRFSTYISVIIPARNEADNIKACLDAIASQSYPSQLFEILVVDDHSTDNTAEIVRSFSAKAVKLISLKDYIENAEIISYKKKAIEAGIQQSRGTLIATTDADCLVYPGWLQTIASFYEMYRPAFIAAPVTMNGRLNFLGIFQSLDFMTLQGITGASVYKKFHCMCNGANLAYEKKVFYEVDGFKGIDTIASGDDMLLMHKIYTRYPDRIMFLKSREAIVQTKPQQSILGFFNQRIRWASKAGKYDDKTILPVLLVVYLLNLLLFLMPLMSLFNNYHLSIVNFHLSIIECWIIVLVLKTITELFFLYPVARFFHRRSLLWFFPLMQPFHIIYTIIAGWLGKFGSYSWKERKVK